MSTGKDLLGEGKSKDLSPGVTWEIPPMYCSPIQAEAKNLCLRSVFVRAGISPCWKGSFSHILRGDMSLDERAHLNKPSQESKEFWLVTPRSPWHLQNNCRAAFWSPVPNLAHIRLTTVSLHLGSICDNLNRKKKKIQKRDSLLGGSSSHFKNRDSTLYYTAKFNLAVLDRTKWKQKSLVTSAVDAASLQILWVFWDCSNATKNLAS